jgi:protein tyrosine/serine phosphatase
MPRRIYRVPAALIMIALAATAVTVWLNPRELPKRFGVVEPGRLYRCGEVTPRQLERLAQRYHLRTVLSLLDPDVPESVAERVAAERLGLRWVNIPLPGDGASTRQQREKIKAALFDLDARPILVHCAAGANRTGLAVGLFRLHQGWDLDQVLAEMREFGFEDSPQHQNLREALASEWRAAWSGSQASTLPVQP